MSSHDVSPIIQGTGVHPGVDVFGPIDPLQKLATSSGALLFRY